MEHLIFSIVMSPILLAGLYGIKLIYDRIGGVATGLYLSGIHFYVIALKVIFREFRHTAQGLVTGEINKVQFTIFEWICIILAFVLMIAGSIVSRRHMRRDSDEE